MDAALAVWTCVCIIYRMSSPGIGFSHSLSELCLRQCKYIHTVILISAKSMIGSECSLHQYNVSNCLHLSICVYRAAFWTGRIVLEFAMITLFTRCGLDVMHDCMNKYKIHSRMTGTNNRSLFDKSNKPIYVDIGLMAVEMGIVSA